MGNMQGNIEQKSLEALIPPTYVDINSGNQEETFSVLPTSINENQRIIMPLTKRRPTFYATFLFTTATLGAGVLNLPYILKETGLLVGVALICGIACISMTSLTLLHQSHMIMLKINPAYKDYEDLGYYCYGFLASFMVKICVVLINFGACVGYLVILGSLLRPLVQTFAANSWIDQEYALIMIISLPIISLGLLKHMADFKFISYMSISTVLAFLLFVFLSWKTGVTRSSGHVQLAKITPSILRVVGVVMFSYSCHTSLCAINQDYDEEGQKEVSTGIILSVIICVAIYSLTGIFGYLSFLDNTAGNLLRSYDNSWYNLVFTFVYCITIFVTYPLVLFPCRVSFENLLKSLLSPCAPWIVGKVEQSEKLSGFVKNHPVLLENVKIFFLTFSLGGVNALLAMIFAEKVEVVFSLTGSVASTFSDYVLPGLFYLKLTKNGWCHPLTLVCFPVIFFGLIFGPISTIITLLGFFNINL